MERQLHFAVSLERIHGRFIMLSAWICWSNVNTNSEVSRWVMNCAPFPKIQSLVYPTIHLEMLQLRRIAILKLLGVPGGRRGSALGIGPACSLWSNVRYDNIKPMSVTWCHVSSQKLFMWFPPIQRAINLINSEVVYISGKALHVPVLQYSS